jgi:diaminopimelate epimerase
MELPKYVVLWPGGNTTAIVTDSVPRGDQARVANEIMGTNREIEQVGYMESAADAQAACRLQMMGGEFCMNATRSAAYYFAKQHGLDKLLVEASGSEKLVAVEIDGDTTHITLPGEFYIQSNEKPTYSVIDLAGIRHLITTGNYDETAARALIAENKDTYEAVGVIYATIEGTNIEIDPLIWVRGTDSFVRETGCGSGSIAVSIAAHRKAPDETTFAVKQPSGETYTITLEPSNEGFKTIKLSGIVKVL